MTRLAESVDEAAKVAGEHAAAADSTRRMAPEVVQLLREAGYARHFVGVKWGGSEGTFTELTQCVITLGQHCASTAWLASLAAYSARFAAHLPAAGHEDMWHAGPDQFVATGLVTGGEAVESGGQWTLSGRWNYVSGVEFADWALVSAPVEGSGEARFFALRREQLEIRSTWDSTGMRATGSNTVVADRVRIPDRLSFPRSDMMSGHNAVSRAACHNVPFQAVGGLTFSAPLAGAAAGALTAAGQQLAGKRRTAATEVELVRSSGRIDAARMLVEQNAEVLDDGDFQPGLRARNERNAAFAAEQCADAVSALIRVAGTGGLSEATTLQRFWRDVVGMSTHVALRYETATLRTFLPLLLNPESSEA